jgi:hypothetical protein
VTTSRYLPPGEVWAKFKGSTAAARTVREPLRRQAAVRLRLLLWVLRRRIRGDLSERAPPAPKGTAPLAMEQRKGGKGHQQSHKKVVRWREFCVIFAYTFLILFHLLHIHTLCTQFLKS